MSRVDFAKVDQVRALRADDPAWIAFALHLGRAHERAHSPMRPDARGGEKPKRNVDIISDFAVYDTMASAVADWPGHPLGWTQSAVKAKLLKIWGEPS
jgi:hypothetical protein